MDDRYKIIAEMPGVDPDNIEIELDDYSISIKGQREEKLETKDEGKQMHMVEHSYGSYYRCSLHCLKILTPTTFQLNTKTAF